MSNRPLSSEEFQASVRKRYATPPTRVSREELERLLAETTFDEATIVAGFAEQASLIIKELGDRADQDLVELGQDVCQKLHRHAQQLALTMPHVFIGDSETT